MSDPKQPSKKPASEPSVASSTPPASTPSELTETEMLEVLAAEVMAASANPPETMVNTQLTQGAILQSLSEAESTADDMPVEVEETTTTPEITAEASDENTDTPKEAEEAASPAVETIKAATKPAEKPSAKTKASKTTGTKKDEKQGRVVVVTSGKGGVGKTTTTANIGTGLARLGFRVVLVDTDIGLRNLDILMGLENRIVYNLVDVIEERCKLQQALVKDKRFPNLSLLAAAQTRDKTAVNEEQMHELVEQLKGVADFVILDSPAGIESGFQNAITAANEAIVVCTPEMSSVRDADRVIGLLEAKETITNYKLVLNRVRPNMIKTNDMMDVEDVLEILSVKLLGVIPEDKDIIISTNKGEPVVNVDASMAGQAYRNIARRVAGEDVPFLNLDAPSSLMERIKGFFSKMGAAS